MSSFGIGGTNAHIILEQAPEFGEFKESREWQMLMVSARSAKSLETLSLSIADYIQSSPSIPLADIAFSLQVGRRDFPFRKVILANSSNQTLPGLRSTEAEGVYESEALESRPQIAFMFTGQGAQYVNMARGVYESEPVFKQQFDECCKFIDSEFGINLLDIIYPAGSQSQEDIDLLSEKLRNTNITQPALFVIEFSLAILLISWGIEPSVMIGHSIGEYVAATLAGVFSLEDALKIVVKRGSLMQSLPPGGMISVSLPEEEISQFLFGDISIATINGQTLTVLSGTLDEIEELVSNLKRQGIEYRRIKTSHAFHSPMMEPILDEFIEYLGGFELKLPQSKFISNLTGKWITNDEATSPEYWAKHMRHTVRFADGIKELMKDPAVIFLEVGPGRSLTIFVKNHPEALHGRTILSSIRHPQDDQPDVKFLLTTVAKLWLCGVEINWNSFYIGEKRRRIPLPSTPFERNRYWIDAGSIRDRAVTQKTRNQKDTEINNWLLHPVWEQTPLLHKKFFPEDKNNEKKYLIFADNVEDGLSTFLVNQLTGDGNDIVVVLEGKTFEHLPDGSFVLSPDNKEHYKTLFECLKEREWSPDRIVHLWSMAKRLDESTIRDEFKHSGFLSLLFLTQELTEKFPNNQVPMLVCSRSIFSVTGEEVLQPNQAILLGPILVFPQENPNISMKLIDFDGKGLLELPSSTLVESIISEFSQLEGKSIAVYRRGKRWIRSYKPTREWIDEEMNYLRVGGVYLITGGLGRIGLAYANHLANVYKANLVLLDQIQFPAMSEWEELSQSMGESNPLIRKINAIKDIAQKAGSLEIITIDVTNSIQVAQIFTELLGKFGKVNGIIHSAGLTQLASMVNYQTLTPQDIEDHFKAKVNGLETLSNVISSILEMDTSIDFVLLQSSLSAVLGGIGLTAYSAANAFMDAFADKQNQISRFPWITVNWDGWNFNDYKTESGFSELSAKAGDSIVELSLIPDEGIHVLEKILSVREINHHIISTADIQIRINKWINPVNITHEEKGELSKSNLYPRPKLQTPYVPPRDEVETSLVKIWQSILGIDEIGVKDDFFELGGHSLLATQLVTRVRDLYKVDFPIRNLFESPTIAGLAGLIHSASDKQNRIKQEPLLKASREVDSPLSFGQQRLWFLDQLDPSSSLYNNFAAIRISGDLDLTIFDSCLTKLIKRHETLRTVFTEKDGNPVQVVLDEIDTPSTVIDISSLNSSDQGAEIINLAREYAGKPFNLGQPPLFGVVYIILGPNEYVVFLITHHIISDGWSVNVLVHEIGIYYSQLSKNISFPIPELQYQYRDYALWQRNWMAERKFEEQLEYWKKDLFGLPSNLDLTTDYPRPPKQSTNGMSIWFDIDEKLTSDLHKFSQQKGVTLFMTLLAGFGLLIYRHTNQNDFAIGTPIANRTMLETEELIGFFLNILVLRIRMDENLEINQLLEEVKETALGAYANQDIPFEMLVDAIQPVRDMSRSPLFQVIFDLQDATMQTFDLPGLRVTHYPIDTGMTKYDLALSMEEHKTMLKGYFNFNTDLFREDTISAMQRQFVMILEQIVSSHSKAVSDFDILLESEKELILDTWNSNELHLGNYQSVMDLIEEQATKYGHRLAIVAGDSEITYSELNNLANQFASELLHSGAKDNCVVALMLDRSALAMIGILGIWKTDSIYLPLDPDAPVDRNKFYLEDSNANIIVTKKEILDQVKAQDDSFDEGKKVLFIDNYLSRKHVIGKDDVPNIHQRPDSKAYLIYTSGSTGKPKGVVVNNTSFANHIRVVKKVFGLTMKDRVLQFSAYSFDQSIEQIAATLVSGATLFLRENEIWEPAKFTEIIKKNKLSVINIQPAYWNVWMQSMLHTGSSAMPGNLRLMVIGGDAILPEHIQMWKDTGLESVRLLNAYGPTETTITSSVYEINLNSFVDEKISRIPIGKPLPNRRYYILDHRLQPVPLGVAGELFIGGDCLSDGYLNQKELTKEKFIELAIGRTGKQRLYRTGDLARYSPTGDVEFLGRIDNQVKLRGFRIELGEIESALNAENSIKEAYVVARTKRISSREEQNQPGVAEERYLLAFVNLHDPSKANSDMVTHLKDYLSGILPGYMVPASYIFIESVPYLSSGKVDRKFLENLEVSEEDIYFQSSPYVAPRSKLESELIEIWNEVLGKDKIGVKDNFFDLGGHSLLATQLIARIRNKYPIEFPLRLLFESPTVEAVAGAITDTLVENELDQSSEEDLEKMLAELEDMSDEDVQNLLNS